MWFNAYKDRIEKQKTYLQIKKTNDIWNFYTPYCIYLLYFASFGKI